MFSRTLPHIVIGVLLGAFLALAHGVFANKDENPLTQLPVEELHIFAEVYARIKEDYVEEVSDEKLLEYAIRGMLNGLDPHSTYLSPDDFTEMQVGTSGEFGGLGIEVTMEDGFVKVITPIDDTPAQRAGIEAGDVIIKLDDESIKGMTLSEAVKLMRGKPGAPITLTVVRDGKEQPLKIKIVRDIIRVKSVRSKMLEPGYGYVRITQFQNHTREELQSQLNDLLQESQGKLRGLVLDLRNNPGGVLNAAVGVADTFLNHGLIVYTQGRIEDSDLKFKARPKDLLEGTPMVVLVNNGSASASEIVAGALQDHKRAVIMGSRTFGKGSVQTILPMNQDKGALKITTARYYTPSGRSIQAEGIVPDIILNRVEIASIKEESNRFSEADLKGHLTNNNEDDAPSQATTPDPDNGDNTPSSDPEDQSLIDQLGEKKDSKKELPLVQRDFALHEALNLLKGLSIVQQPNK